MQSLCYTTFAAIMSANIILCIPCKPSQAPGPWVASNNVFVPHNSSTLSSLKVLLFVEILKENYATTKFETIFSILHDNWGAI